MIFSVRVDDGNTFLMNKKWGVRALHLSVYIHLASSIIKQYITMHGLSCAMNIQDNVQSPAMRRRKEVKCITPHGKASNLNL